MPITLKNLVDLTLPEYLIIIFFGFISCGLVIQNGLPNFWLLVLPFVSVSFGMLGLNVLNNIVDVNLDKINKPSRPLVSGRVSLKEAKIVCLAVFVLAVLFAFFISIEAVLLILLFIFLAIIYSVPPIQLRKYFLLSNLIGGVEYSAIPFLLTWLVLGNIFPMVFFLFFYFLVFTGAFIKDFEDIEGEKKLGYQTLPIFVGRKKAATIILAIYLIINTGMLFAISRGFVATKFFLPLIISYLLVGLMALIFLKELKKIGQKVVTQAKVMTYSMLIVSVIQLVYALVILL